VRVSVPKYKRSFEAAPDRSLLDAALDASLNLPHSCKSGNCGACRARLLDGEIHYPNGRPLGLSDQEVAEGLVLMCQARALTDVAIETFDVATPDEIIIKRLPARIERVLPLSHDVMGLYLKLPAAEEFHFEAGQYIDIMLSRGRRRSFSIASPPQESRLLELHVRRVAGGEFSEQLFQGARSTLLAIEGPLGQFTYRGGRDAAPMLLVGGGTGLAPLISIIKHLRASGIERDMTLYWGVRSERDLYARAMLEELAGRAAVGAPAQPQPAPQLQRQPGPLRYVPVLSEPSPQWRGARGLVHEAVLRDIEDLAGYDVYAAGPPAMIAAVQREFVLRGVDPSRLFFDSFDYAPDSAERHAISAATKS
jgi:CDP-4-dehydro-6-deoxyglucose reductase